MVIPVRTPPAMTGIPVAVTPPDGAAANVTTVAGLYPDPPMSTFAPPTAPLML